MALMFVVQSPRSMTSIMTTLKMGQKLMARQKSDSSQMSLAQKRTQGVTHKYRMFYASTGVAVLVISVSGIVNLREDHSWVVSPSTLIPASDYGLKLIYVAVSVVGHRLFWSKLGSRAGSSSKSSALQSKKGPSKVSSTNVTYTATGAAVYTTDG